MDVLTRAGNQSSSPVLVVRLSTECWEDHRGVNITRRIRWLKRRSHEGALCSVVDDVSGGGVGEFLGRVENLNESPDGVYVLRPTNLSSDWETGIIDDWDYVLEETTP